MGVLLRAVVRIEANDHGVSARRTARPAQAATPGTRIDRVVAPASAVRRVRTGQAVPGVTVRAEDSDPATETRHGAGRRIGLPVAAAASPAGPVVAGQIVTEPINPSTGGAVATRVETGLLGGSVPERDAPAAIVRVTRVVREAMRQEAGRGSGTARPTGATHGSEMISGGNTGHAPRNGPSAGIVQVARQETGSAASARASGRAGALETADVNAAATPSAVVTGPDGPAGQTGMTQTRVMQTRVKQTETGGRDAHRSSVTAGPTLAAASGPDRAIPTTPVGMAIVVEHRGVHSIAMTAPVAKSAAGSDPVRGRTTGPARTTIVHPVRSIAAARGAIGPMAVAVAPAATADPPIGTAARSAADTTARRATRETGPVAMTPVADSLVVPPVLRAGTDRVSGGKTGGRGPLDRRATARPAQRAGVNNAPNDAQIVCDPMILKVLIAGTKLRQPAWMKPR